MPDRPLVTLSPFLFEDDLHFALGVLHHRRLDANLLRGDDGVATDSEFAGADLVNVGELEDVTDLDVVETWHGEEVARREEVFPAGEACNDVLRRLRAN